ncbi:hypothetical protein L1049_004627 [Liquidambar formosana]|uniref:Uncharacterized protein n=1 Tax=Liquidambar formosana TaxID=63359 RepID=A0AAP0X0W9_LIQFO
MDSPELHPLPPLTRQNFTQNHGNAEVGSTGDDEEEEFYSPRGSSGDPESSNGAGSGSRRAFESIAAANFGSRSSESSSCSCSSSNSGSPARSISISISPPVSLSPRSLKPKSPEPVVTQAPPPHPPPPPPPPLLSPFMTQLEFNRKSPCPSTSPSPPSSSPERGLNKNPDASPRLSNVSDRNPQSPARIDNPFQQQVSVPPPPPPPPPPRTLGNSNAFYTNRSANF